LFYSFLLKSIYACSKTNNAKLNVSVILLNAGMS